MEDFFIEHWQLIASLGAALLNFLFALIVHKRSSGKIAKLSSSEAAVDDALFEVSEKLHALISSISEEIYGKESAQKKISADVPEVPEEARR